MDPLTHMVESVVAHHDGQQVVDTANYLMDGFAKLRTRQEPRLHAELMRAIQTIPSDTMTRVVRELTSSARVLLTAANRQASRTAVGFPHTPPELLGGGYRHSSHRHSSHRHYMRCPAHAHARNHARRRRRAGWGRCA